MRPEFRHGHPYGHAIAPNAKALQPSGSFKLRGILSVGGSGLLSGVVEGLRRNGRRDVPVIAVETEGAASFRAAVEAGHAVELERITSVATSLGARRVCEQAVRWSREHPVESVLLSDRIALLAFERFLADHRMLVEPAYGASLAAAYENVP